MQSERPCERRHLGKASASRPKVQEAATVSLPCPFFTKPIYIQSATIPEECILLAKPLFTHLHHSKKSEQERTATQTTTMSTSSLIVTLASDVLILGAGISIVAIALGYVLYQNRELLPASINAIIGDTKSHSGKSDGLQQLL